MLAFEYLPEQNPERRYIDGVPLRSLTVEDVAQLSDYLQRSVAACPFYRAVSTAPHTPDAVQTASRRARASGPSETKTEPDATES